MPGFLNVTTNYLKKRVSEFSNVEHVENKIHGWVYSQHEMSITYEIVDMGGVERACGVVVVWTAKGTYKLIYISYYGKTLTENEDNNQP